MSVGQVSASNPGPSQRHLENTPTSPNAKHLRSPRSAQSLQNDRPSEVVNPSATVYITSPRPSATRLYSSTSPPTSNMSSVFAALGRTETTASNWDTEQASETDDGVPRRRWAHIVIWVALLLIVIAGVVVGIMIGLTRQSHGNNGMGSSDTNTSQSLTSISEPSWTPAIDSAVSSLSAANTQSLATVGIRPTSTILESASQSLFPTSI